MTRRFTGWHMTAIMLAMFGTIIAVNVTMARFAIGTFGGVVVENSYVASQHFNRWLGEARDQQRLGWRVAVAVDATRRVTVTAADPAGPIATAQVSALATHPLGRAPDRTLAFVPAGDGRFISTAPLPAGRWLIHLSIRQGGHEARFEDQVPA